MRKNIATCYSERAIKVTDSYCSGPLSNESNYRSPCSIPAFKKAVRCLYRAKLSSDENYLIRMTWNRAQGFSISICEYTCSTSLNKLNRNWRQIQKVKGSISIHGGSSSRIEVFWDLTNASYDVGPEPVTGFCILVLINSEIALFLGDRDRELTSKNCGSELRVARFSLVSRCEYFSGSAEFSTKARFSEAGASHDILIRCTGEGKGAKNSALSVCIDQRNVIQVKRLEWNFRGNQTIFVDGLLVDLMWDAHDWIFNPKSGCAVFMFRTRRGLENNRLWLEEKNLEQKEHDKLGLSFLICAYKNSS